MSRALETALFSLLPTYSQNLPQPLVELASSLLTQSRHRASTLRQEEEAARSYACCHIACERLKVSLDLPPIQPRPPIPPRQYNRLYTHLEKILPASSPTKSGRVRTPNSKVRGSGALGSSQRVSTRGTPSKDASLTQFRSPAKRGGDTPTKSTGKPPAIPAKKKAGGVTSALPPWVRPTIQLLCKELDDERIGRTVLAGMQTIAAPHGRPSKDKWVNENLTPLLAAIYFLVSAQLYVLEEGGKFDNKLVARMRKPILKTLNRAQAEVTVRDMDEDELWIGWSDTGPEDFNSAIRKVQGSEWLDEDWFTGIKHLARADVPEEDDEDMEMEDGEVRTSKRFHLQKGDTMFQSRWIMTDKKREEYQAWKEEMIRRIEEIERTQEAGKDVDALP